MLKDEKALNKLNDKTFQIQGLSGCLAEIAMNKEAVEMFEKVKEKDNNNDCLYLNKEICVRKHRLAFQPSLRVDFIQVHLA